jgi:hypothetical protein
MNSNDIGVIEWVLQKSHLETVITAAETITVGVTAANVSNLLLVLYVISYVVTRKAAFIVAFLFVETVGMLDPFEHYFIAPAAINVTYEYYYFIYAGLYSICYLYFFFIYQSLKACLGYFILVLFELLMCFIEATEVLEQSIEANIYNNYEYIILVVHIYIISTLVRWTPIPLNIKGLIGRIYSKFYSSYFYSCFWYNCQQSQIKKLQK